MEHTRRYTTDNGILVEETRLLFADFHISYNADYVVRALRRVVISGPPEVVGKTQVTSELPKVYTDESEDTREALSRWQRDHLVNDAKKLAEIEGRLLLPLSAAFEKEFESWQTRES